MRYAVRSSGRRAQGAGNREQGKEKSDQKDALLT